MSKDLIFVLVIGLFSLTIVGIIMLFLRGGKSPVVDDERTPPFK